MQRLALILIAFVSSLLCSAQSAGTNYVKSETMTDTTGYHSLTSIIYYDGLGRPIQDVDGYDAPFTLSNFLYTSYTYDAKGRTCKRSLQGVGGHVSEALDELVEAGFVSRDSGLNPETGAQVREVRYRISDNYVRFYLRFIAPRAEAIRKGLFRLASMDQLPGWKSILGIQFESLILNNLPAILPRIGIGNALVLSAAPFSRNATRRGDGVQIDLLIQTRSSVYVIEVKRRATIPASIEDEVRQKVGRLHVERGKSIRTALVYEGELSPEIAENGFFDALVPFGELLT